MKKTLFAIMTITAMTLSSAAVSAAIAPAAAPMKPAAPTAAAPAQPLSTVSATAKKDPNTVIVKVNGVEMTQAQARQVILANLKNHKQMTPEEMVAYINKLEAEAEVK